MKLSLEITEMKAWTFNFIRNHYANGKTNDDKLAFELMNKVLRGYVKEPIVEKRDDGEQK